VLRNASERIADRGTCRRQVQHDVMHAVLSHGLQDRMQALRPSAVIKIDVARPCVRVVIELKMKGHAEVGECARSDVINSSSP
jgi:hypothetical protein